MEIVTKLARDVKSIQNKGGINLSEPINLQANWVDYADDTDDLYRKFSIRYKGMGWYLSENSWILVVPFSGETKYMNVFCYSSNIREVLMAALELPIRE